ncbi:MAG TPA: type III pantothenate kinase [Luteibaculaceae bacterium]|nr:type III pantothenate kinase [Luteibaculaceae bacterium]
MYLVVDIGNTATKAALFQDGEWVERIRIPNGEGADTASMTSRAHAVLVANVASPELAEPWLKGAGSSFLLNASLKLPYTTQYPDTLGQDRMANAAAAAVMHPMGSVLVIDIGTCLKFDFVHRSTFVGGSIAPGVFMRFQAMQAYTARLPIPREIRVPKHFIGTHTEENLLSGVLFGMMGEIQAGIDRYQSIYPDLHIILTGGDAAFFEGTLKSNIFAEPDLTLLGLYHILKLNAT